MDLVSKIKKKIVITTWNHSRLECHAELCVKTYDFKWAPDCRKSEQAWWWPWWPSRGGLSRGTSTEEAKAWPATRNRTFFWTGSSTWNRLMLMGLAFLMWESVWCILWGLRSQCDVISLDTLPILNFEVIICFCFHCCQPINFEVIPVREKKTTNQEIETSSAKEVFSA